MASNDEGLGSVGPTVIDGRLMIDAKIAREMPVSSKAWAICDSLSAVGACGVIENTLVVHLSKASEENRKILLDPASWGLPAGDEENELTHYHECPNGCSPWTCGAMFCRGPDKVVKTCPACFARGKTR